MPKSGSIVAISVTGRPKPRSIFGSGFPPEKSEAEGSATGEVEGGEEVEVDGEHEGPSSTGDDIGGDVEGEAVINFA